MKFEEYYDGLDMAQFKHIPDISHYNHNYYVGFKRGGFVAHDLLLAVSDDDVRTDWFILRDKTFVYLGEECGINQRFTRYESIQT